MPALDLRRFVGVPFPVSTVAELRRPLAVTGMGVDLLLLPGPRAFVDRAFPRGAASRGVLRGDVLHTAGGRFDRHGRALDGGADLEPVRCLALDGVVFCWLGDASEAAVRLRLPSQLGPRWSLCRVTMDAPFYLALWNAVDYAHFPFHRTYREVYAAYRRLRGDAHLPGTPFHWQVTERGEDRLRVRLPEAGRTLLLWPTAAQFEDDGGVNRFQTLVQPIGPRRTVYWELYSARTERPLVRLAAHAAFRTVVAHLLRTEDRVWTSASTDAFLSGHAHLAETDIPLGAHLRHFVLPYATPGGAAAPAAAG